MPGPVPKLVRRRRTAPRAGEWQAIPDGGWRGKIPPAPEGLTAETQQAWQEWFSGPVAAMWTEDDLPGLQIGARTFDVAFTRGKSSLRLRKEAWAWLNSYGLTPKGYDMRRWRILAD